MAPEAQASLARYPPSSGGRQRPEGGSSQPGTRRRVAFHSRLLSISGDTGFWWLVQIPAYYLSLYPWGFE